MTRALGHLFVDAVFFLAAAALVIVGAIVMLTMYPDVPFWTAAIIALGTPVVFSSALALILLHEMFLRDLAVASIPSYANRENAFLTSAEHAVLLALPGDVLHSATHAIVRMSLKRRPFIALDPDRADLCSNADGSSIERFAPEALSHLEATLQKEIRKHMSPWLAPLASYLWPDRVMEFRYSFSSRHDAMAKISAARAALTQP